MKHSTPILSVIQRQHAEDDKKARALGRDPYHHGFRRHVDPEAAITDAQREEASAILACYETDLTIQE